jgi:transposase
VIVDALGNPLALSLTGGNAHDITQAEPLAAQVEPEALLGDKGYDADSFITSLEVRAIKAVIPPKSTRKVKRACDFALYAERNLVERFFPSSIIEVSRHPTRKPRATSSLAYIWSALLLGSNDDRP